MLVRLFVFAILSLGCLNAYTGGVKGRVRLNIRIDPSFFLQHPQLPIPKKSMVVFQIPGEEPEQGKRFTTHGKSVEKRLSGITRSYMAGLNESEKVSSPGEDGQVWVFSMENPDELTMTLYQL